MPAFDTSTPTEVHTIQGMDLSVPYLFNEGNELTADEAKWVNTVLAGVVGNAYSGDIRRALATLDKERAEAAVKAGKPVPKSASIADLKWDHQAKFLDKFAKYELGVSNRSGAKTSKDPVIGQMTKIASDFVKDYLRSKKQSVKKFIDAKNSEHGSEFNRLVADYLAANGDAVRAQAEAKLAAMKASTESTTLNLGALAEAA